MVYLLICSVLLFLQLKTQGSTEESADYLGGTVPGMDSTSKDRSTLRTRLAAAR